VRVAIGLKAHSGWAASVAIGISGKGYKLVDRRRIDLVAAEDIEWAKQPYHAAEDLEPDEAKALVERAISSACRIAAREIHEQVDRISGSDHLAAFGLLVPSPMPDWSVEEILSVHIRMHMAEGVMYPDVLAEAIDECGINVVRIREKTLSEKAATVFGVKLDDTLEKLAYLGRSAGPPWTKDQKMATLAAAITLQTET
jgi:hypothetical protein